ncbi:MAG: DUF3575 domain-containing protein [Bacteroidaceae bacterium]|nr:DUF3575 domain-containing protein [Bacteroidaceae bacterium]
MLIFSAASSAEDSVSVDNVRLVHASDSVQLRMTLRLSDLTVGKRDVWLLVPRLVNGADSIEMPSVGIYGRIPYYYAVRSGLHLYQDECDIMLRAKEVRGRKGAAFSYARTLRHRAWLEGAEVKLFLTHIACCGDVMDSRSWRVLETRLVQLPDSIVYRRFTKEAHGTAHVDFVLDSIWIDPAYHDNRHELGKISRLLDSLQADPRIHIDSVTFHGYASPEGPYRHNVWLAKNRVKALADYIIEKHRLDPAIVSQQYTPEDWVGLRRYVEASSLPHRAEILAVIDDTVRRPDPDVRLRYIRRTYVEDFADIFDNSLPFLRHTDYTILYTTDGTREERIPGRIVPRIEEDVLVPDTPFHTIPPLPPLFAVKTNLLLDAIAWPNVEVEVPFGKNAQWSLMAEWGSPWYVWHHNSRAYEILNVGLELRRWLGKCPDCRPVLTGGFVGLYAAVGKYDIEWNSIGDQGEYLSFGASAGYSWLLRKCLNLEVSGSLGVLFGPQRHYHGEFSDTHLIWKSFDDLFYVGPTQLKVSIVWLIPRKWFGLDKKKGGEQ